MMAPPDTGLTAQDSLSESGVHQEEVLSFLHYGYVPAPNSYSSARPSPTFDWPSLAPRRMSTTEVEEELVAEGVSALKRAFPDTSGSLHVVPLSGGLDSRAVLGGLLEQVDKARIVTVTFGIPGAMDFEIGSALARHLGLAHVPIDLSQIEPSTEGLVGTARTMEGWTFLFDAFYNRLLGERFGRSAVYWSGFMGDALAGAHLPPMPSTSWEGACEYFAQRNKMVRGIVMTPQSFRPETVLPPAPLLPPELLDFDDQLDFVVRQGSYIRPTLVVPGFDIRTPMLTPDWVGFILSVPRGFRQQRSLYRKILTSAYPSLFGHPSWRRRQGSGIWASLSDLTRAKLGRVRTSLGRRWPPLVGSSMQMILWSPLGVHAAVNYVDFDAVVRDSATYRRLLRHLLDGLLSRRCVDWLDVEMLWDRATRARPGAGTAVALLGALEVWIRQRKERRGLLQVPAGTP